MVEREFNLTSLLGKPSLLFWFLFLMCYSIREINGLVVRLDVLFVSIFILFTIIENRLDYRQFIRHPYLKWLTYFSLWTVVVNCFYSFTLSDYAFLVNSCIYFLIVSFLLAIFLQLEQSFEKFVRVSLIGVFVSFFVILICSFIVEEEFWRYRVLFTNVNQLGRYCLFALTVVVIFRKRLNFVSDSVFVFCIGVATAMIFLSYSRAAMISLFILLVISFIYDKFPTLFGISVGSLLFICVNLLQQSSEPFANIETKMIERFTQTESGYDHSYYRGYDRLLDFPEYLVFGAGEQQQKRFDKYGYEVHSSLFGVLFNYGVLGLIFIIALLFNMFKRVSLKDLVILVPIAIHGLVHNDIRSLFMWLVLALVFFLCTDVPVKTYSKICI